MSDFDQIDVDIFVSIIHCPVISEYLWDLEDFLHDMTDSDYLAESLLNLHNHLRYTPECLCCEQKRTFLINLYVFKEKLCACDQIQTLLIEYRPPFVNYLPFIEEYEKAEANLISLKESMESDIAFFIVTLPPDIVRLIHSFLRPLKYVPLGTVDYEDYCSRPLLFDLFQKLSFQQYVLIEWERHLQFMDSWNDKPGWTNALIYEVRTLLKKFVF